MQVKTKEKAGIHERLFLSRMPLGFVASKAFCSGLISSASMPPATGLQSHENPPLFASGNRFLWIFYRIRFVILSKSTHGFGIPNALIAEVFIFQSNGKMNGNSTKVWAEYQGELTTMDQVTICLWFQLFYTVSFQKSLELAD